jgi:glycosyltransferase involved in cell wall biosynthesis
MGRNLQLNVLYVVPYVPNRVRTRPFHLIRTLAALGHRVTLATVWTNGTDLEDVESLKPFLQGVILEKVSAGSSIANCIRAIPSGEPFQAHYSWSADFSRRIVAAAKGGAYDVIHVEHLRGAKYGLAIEDALGAQASTPVVWDSVDCISLLFEHASGKSPALRTRLAARLELGRTRRFEGRVTSAFSGIAVTSDVDRRALLALRDRWLAEQGEAPAADSGARVVVVPNGVDLEYFAPRPDEAKQGNAIVFSGKMSYHANAGAVRRLVEGVMPRIWSERPDTELWIAGKDPSAEIRSLGVPFEDAGGYAGPKGDPRVKITGTVEDIRPFLRRAAAAIAPLEYAVGIQNKVLEAMACGTPVIVSDSAAQSLAAEPGEEIFVGASDRQLAELTLALLADEGLRGNTGAAGRAFVERKHEWKAIAAGLQDLYVSARERV